MDLDSTRTYPVKAPSLDPDSGIEMGSYTKRPITMEVMKVPRIANVMIASKFEKNGFYKINNNIMINYS